LNVLKGQKDVGLVVAQNKRELDDFVKFLEDQKFQNNQKMFLIFFILKKCILSWMKIYQRIFMILSRSIRLVNVEIF